MALPSAQLGSMTSLNVPSGMPTVVTQPKEKYWQKILAQALAGAAGQAATQGVSNAMSRDYAADAGGTNAPFWDKLVGGPAMPADQYKQLAATKAQMGLQDLAAADTRRGQEYHAQQSDLRDTTNSARDYDRMRAQLSMDNQKMRVSSDEKAADRAANKESNAARDALLRRQGELLEQEIIRNRMTNDQIAKGAEAQFMKDPEAMTPKQRTTAERAQSPQYNRSTDYQPQTGLQALAEGLQEYGQAGPMLPGVKLLDMLKALPEAVNAGPGASSSVSRIPSRNELATEMQIIRAKMPSMSLEEQAQAEARLRELNAMLKRR